MDFFERMKTVMARGFDTTKEALGQAADKAKELGEKGILRFEISQLEREAGKKFSALGSIVYRSLVDEGKNTVSKGTAEVKSFLMEIDDLKNRIESKEKDLKKMG